MNISTFLLSIAIISAGLLLGVLLVRRLLETDKLLRMHLKKKKSAVSVLEKKHPEADVQRYRPTIMRISFIVVLLIAAFAFRVSNQGHYMPTSYEVSTEEDDFTVVPTRHAEEKKEEVPVDESKVDIVEDDVPLDVVEDDIPDPVDPVDDNGEGDQADEGPVVDLTPDDIDLPVEDDFDENAIFIVVEDSAGFPGGISGLMGYLADNIRYPAIAQENGIEGMVVLRFVVGKDGWVRDIEVLKDVAGGCTAEAVRVVQDMPQWEPGRQRGRPVNVYFTLPVKFALNR